MNEFEEACSLLAPLFGLALGRLTDVEALVLVNVDFYAIPQVDVAKKLKRTRCNVCRTRRRGFDKFSAACNELIDQSPRRGFLREMLSSQAFRRELVVVMEQSIRRRLACPEESIPWPAPAVPARVRPGPVCRKGQGRLGTRSCSASRSG